MDEDEMQRAIAEAIENAPHVPMAFPGTEIAVATLEVLTERFGGAFSTAVRDKISERADRMDKSDDEHDRLDAPEVRRILDWPMWDRLAAKSSRDDLGQQASGD